jgi:ArsR family transcriptional regulator
VSKQLLPLATATACCTPLVREPLDERSAAELARVFKALSDPVRLRLLSLIAIGTRGDARHLDQSIDKLIDRATSP